MRFETGKTKGTIVFQTGKYALHMLIFFTDSRLDMVISVMLIKKKTCKLIKRSPFRLDNREASRKFAGG